MASVLFNPQPTAALLAGSGGVAGANRGDEEAREGLQVRRQGEVGSCCLLFFAYLGKSGRSLCI